MAADSTLVRTSLQESISGAGADVPNLKPLYESNVKIGKGYLGIVTGAIDAFKKDEEALRIGKDGQLKGFKNIVRKGREKLAAGETMPQKVLDAMDRKIKELQDEFEAVNTYGKGDNAENEKARIRINARLQKVINQAVKNREIFTKLGDSIDNWNHGEIGEDIIAPQQKMMDLDNVDLDDDTKIYFNENDKLVYSTKNYHSDGTGDEVSYTLEQMWENIGQKDVSMDADILKQTKVSGATGLKHGKDPNQEYNFNVDLEKREFLVLIKTEEDFKNISRRPIDGLTDFSFRDGLIDNMEISFDILDNMFYDDNGTKMNIGEAFKNLDLSGDEKITKEDFTTETIDSKNLSGEALELFKANKREFLDALTDISHPAFDFQRSKSLIGDYFTGIKKQSYDAGFRIHGVIPGEEKPINIKNIKGQQLIGNDGQLYNPAKGENQTVGAQGYKYNKKGQLLYNENEKLAKLRKHEEIVDAFGNTYKPTTHIAPSNTMAPDEKVKGYIVHDSDGVPIKFDDEFENKYLIDNEKIFKTKDGYIFFIIEQAKRNLVGTSKSIG